MKKVYIVRKYILANSVEEALRKEKKHKPDDAFVESNSINNFIENLQKTDPPPMGFKKK